MENKSYQDLTVLKSLLWAPQFEYLMSLLIVLIFFLWFHKPLFNMQGSKEAVRQEPKSQNMVYQWHPEK